MLVSCSCYLPLFKIKSPKGMLYFQNWVLTTETQTTLNKCEIWDCFLLKRMNYLNGKGCFDNIIDFLKNLLQLAPAASRKSKRIVIKEVWFYSAWWWHECISVTIHPLSIKKLFNLDKSFFSKENNYISHNC